MAALAVRPPKSFDPQADGVVGEHGEVVGRELPVALAIRRNCLRRLIRRSTGLRRRQATRSSNAHGRWCADHRADTLAAEVPTARRGCKPE